MPNREMPSGLKNEQQEDWYVLNRFANGSPEGMGLDVSGLRQENLPGAMGAYERRVGEEFRLFIQRAERGVARYCLERGAVCLSNIDRAGLDTNQRIVYAGVVWVYKQ